MGDYSNQLHPITLALLGSAFDCISGDLATKTESPHVCLMPGVSLSVCGWVLVAPTWAVANELMELSVGLSEFNVASSIDEKEKIH